MRPVLPGLPGTARLRRAAGVGAQVVQQVRNAVAAGGFAEQASRNGLVPDGGVALYFCTEPANLFQLEQWRRPL
jgi:hypothetical protein